MNSRLDELQAALLRVKIPYLAEWIARRQAIAARYDKGLTQIPGVHVPVVDSAARHVYHQYTIRIESAGERNRDSLVAFLKEQGIGSTVYYPLSLNEQKCFAHLEVANACPISQQLTNEVLSLPVYPELSDDEVDRVIATIARALTQ
jgi:dTDP-4-amino-4,6-dideoxygalactose transaminase